jgi:hypothetical protein
MKFVKTLQEADVLPRGFGVAWRTPQGTVALPLGVNVVAAWCRRVWIGLRMGITPAHVDKLILATQRNAHEAGRDDAIQEIQRQVELRFGDRLRELRGQHSEPESPEAIGNATADATELEHWSQEDRVLFAAAQELAKRRGDALYMACQDPRCARQPILGRIEGDGGFWLACMHKRRWVPTPKGQQQRVSRRALARVGIH